MNVFERDSVVCFLGDSITARGDWQARIFDYYVENFPDRKVKFYNCGIGGGRAITAIPRLECDVFRHNPTHIIVMFGMNDSGYYLYEDGKILTEQEKQWKEETQKQYTEYMKYICDEVLNRGIKLILCTPTPYDEMQICGNAVCRCDFILADFSEKIRALSQKLNAPLIDFRKDFLAVIEKIRKENPNNNLISPDRVHPNLVGMEVMADIFLKNQGIDRNLDLSFEKWQKKAQMPYSHQNLKRMEIENKLRALGFIKWDYILNRKPETKDDFEFLRNSLTTEDGKQFKETITFYLDNLHLKEEWEEELDKATQNMY